MQYHQYSKLFTSGLLSDPSPPPRVPRRRPRRGRMLFLNPTDSETPEPLEARTHSFLELADSLVSPVSPTDQSFSWRSLGRHHMSTAAGPTIIGKPVSNRIPKGVLRSSSLNPTSPFDTLPGLSIADQSFLITDPSLPDSPTLDRRPTHKTAVSVSATSVSLSVNSETKRTNRLIALACLEGRESCPGRAPKKAQLNFMSMSDDEDEDDTVAPSPHSSADRSSSSRSSTIAASDASVLAILSSGRKEIEFLSPEPEQPRTTQEGNRCQNVMMDSWFPPLSDFADLKDGEDSLNWGSFIEFSAPTA